MPNPISKNSDKSKSMPHSAIMRPVRPLAVLAIYIAVTLLVGALFAPWLYWLVQQHPGLFSVFGQFPFERFVHRSMLLFAILGLWPLIWSLGFRSWADLGLVRPRDQWRKFLAGFLLGFFVLALVSAVVLIAQARTFSADVTAKALFVRVAIALCTGVVVAVIEETLFRGAVFGGLRKGFSWQTAAIISSVIFASLHFLGRAEHVGEVTPYSGAVMVPQMLSGLINVEKTIPKFLNLVLVALLLAFVYQRSGNLYLPIGLHAGGIAWIKLFKTLTVPVPGAATALWGHAFVLDGWFAVAVLLVALAVAPRLMSFYLGLPPADASARTGPMMRSQKNDPS